MAKPKLSERQQQVLYLVSQGKTNDEIAGELGISPKTIEKHRSAIADISGCRTAVLQLRWAIEQGLIRVRVQNRTPARAKRAVA